MTKFLLVRHGQTDWNQQGRYQGHADQPLNEVGRAQAEYLSSQISKDSITAVYSSDLVRALETAQIIASKLGMEVQVDRRLREISLGAWEGMYFDDIIAQYPREWYIRQSDPVNARPPGGETLAELADRIRAFADQASRLHPHTTLLVISHGLAMAALYCLANGISLAEAYRNVPENAKLLEICWPPMP